MGALDCHELEPLLQPYVDGEFEAGDRDEVESHLLVCAHCRHMVEHEKSLRAAIRGVAATAAPARLRNRIEGRLKTEHRWSLVRRALRPEVIIALAASAGFVAFVSGRSLLEPLLDDAVDHHAHNLPIEVHGDAARIQSWFAGKVDFNVRVPHFRNANLEGGRLSHVQDHSAAYVVYQGPRAHRVSLFVFDDPRAPFDLGMGGHRERIANHDVVFANARGYNVAIWRDHEIVYSLVSDLDEHDIAALLRERGPDVADSAPAALPNAALAVGPAPVQGPPAPLDVRPVSLTAP